MKRNLNRLQYLLSSIMVLLTSCVIPLTDYAQISSITPATIEGPEIIKEIIEMIPIKIYEKYAVDSNNRVFGLIGNKKEVIVLKDEEGKEYPFNDFFIVDLHKYFNTKIFVDGTEEIPDTDPMRFVQVEKIRYFIQFEGKITEIEENEYSNKPESVHVEMGIAPWSIVTGDYKGTAISTIKQVISKDNQPAPGFLCIDGYMVIPNAGVWFSVSQSLPNAEKGLYYSALNSGRFRKVSEYGRIWG